MTMDRARIDRALADAVTEGRATGVVAAVAAQGEGLVYEGAHGVREVGAEARMTTDTVFRIFSMTEAVGAAAAAKLAEDGALDLDAPVESVVPEFGRISVLEGFAGDEPRLRAPVRRATIRQLATHTSGLVYEFWNEDQARFLEVAGKPSILSGERSALTSYPLAFDPGARWDYGVGIDWLGQVIETVAGEPIDAFCRRVFFEPLGTSSTGFELSDSMAGRICTAHAAREGGFERTSLSPPAHPEFHGMGHALYSTGPDYLRFLRMILNGGALDGARVLGPKGVEAMRANQIGDLEVGPLRSLSPALSADVEFFPEQSKKHTLGFMMTTEDVPGKRRAGSLSGAGILNTHCWIDPESGLAAVLMLQHIPFADANCMAVYDAFERAVYA